MRIGRRASWIGGLGACLLAFCTGPAWAHGGSHPTPWPNPTPTPVPTPGPSPDSPGRPSRPFPNPTPTPTPGRPTTPSTPGTTQPGTPRFPNGPTGPTGPTQPGRAPAGDDRTGWEVWWHLHRWHYLQVARNQRQVTGQEPGSAQRYDDVWEFLLERMRDDYFDIRSASCLALGRGGHAGLAGWMQKNVHDRHPEVQESALIGLGSLGSPMPVFHMSAMLKNPAVTTRLRAAAALGLGLTGDVSAVPMLRAALANDPDAAVQGAAALGLGICGGSGDVAALTAIVRDARADRMVRAYAIAALGQLAARLPGGDEPAATTTLLRALLRSDRNDHVRRAATNALITIGDAAALPDVRRAMQNDSDTMVRRFAMVAAAELARGRTEAAAVLADLLKSAGGGNGGERGFACLALGLLGEARAGEPLGRLLRGGGQNDTRAAAALALGLLRHRPAHAECLAVATSRSDTRLRGYATLAVGLIAEEAAVPELRTLLANERDPVMRASAALALGCTGAARDVKALAALLEDQNAYLRMSTATALGLLRDDAALDPIRKHYGTEESQEVRTMLVVALGRITQRDAVAPFHRLVRWLDYTARNDVVDLAMRLE